MLVKDFPRWTDGWRTVKKVIPSKRKTASSVQGSHEAVGESYSIAEKIVTEDANQGLRDCPTGTKIAKEVIRDDKVAQKALIKQAIASEVMADAVMRKVGAMEDHNLILLMTVLDEGGVLFLESREFMKLSQREELRKLQKRLITDEQKDLDDAVGHDTEEQLWRATKLARQATEQRDNEETRRQLEEQIISLPSLLVISKFLQKLWHSCFLSFF